MASFLLAERLSWLLIRVYLFRANTDRADYASVCVQYRCVCVPSAVRRIRRLTQANALLRFVSRN